RLAVLELCTRALLIDQGAVRFDGDPAAAIQAYRAKSVPSDRPASDGDVRITEVTLLDARGRATWTIETAGALTIRILYTTSRPVDQPQFAIDIHRGDGTYCYGTNTRLAQLDVGT